MGCKGVGPHLAEKLRIKNAIKSKNLRLKAKKKISLFGHRNTKITAKNTDFGAKNSQKPSKDRLRGKNVGDSKINFGDKVSEFCKLKCVPHVQKVMSFENCYLFDPGVNHSTPFGNTIQI